MATNGSAEIGIRVLTVINEERTTHGLRFNDRPRYRRHCTNKIHRLRQILKLTHGKEKTYRKPPPVSQEALKEGHLLLTLFETERAWTYALELQNESTQSKVHSPHRLSLSRFRRAVALSAKLHGSAAHLLSLDPPRISGRSYAEVVAYELMVRASFSRSKDEYEPAIIDFSVAKSILDCLSETASSSRDQALYSVFSDSIGPEIRYCAHQTGRAKAYDIDSIAEEIAPKNGEKIVKDYKILLSQLRANSGASTSSDLDAVLWDGLPVPVRSPELVDAFLRVQKAERLLREDGKRKKPTTVQPNAAAAVVERNPTSRAKFSAYDAILSALSDAEDVAKKAIEAQESLGTRQPSAPGARDAQFVHAYVSFQLLAYRIQRDLLIVDALLQPQQPSKVSSKQPLDQRSLSAIIKNLDSILQSLDQMRSLSISDESPEVASTLEGRLAFTKAKRTRYLSLVHAGLKNYANAVALNSGSQLHIREARNLQEATTESPVETTFYSVVFPDDVEAFQSTLEEDADCLKKEWFAYNGGVGTSTSGLQVKHRKPLFFDVAFNYIESPLESIQKRSGKAPREKHPEGTSGLTVASTRGKVDVEDDLDEVEEPKETVPVAGGISGFLGSWWGKK